MGEKEQDTLARAIVRLSALRNNVTKMSLVPETYVAEYHKVLDKLVSVKIDVSEFRIPEQEIKPEAGPVDYLSGRVTKYSSERYVSERFFLIQIDTILGYLKVITSEKPRGIGFNK
ncbi:hypothetical protein ACFLW0_05620 [Chloroflexota bacterium]